MPFTATPLVGGDAHDQASRIGEDTDRELAMRPDAAEQAAHLARRWKEIAGLGWMATAIPEAAGGAGGSLEDLAALAGGAGRGGLPLPVAASCGVAPRLLAGHRLLGALAEGRAQPCVILPGEGDLRLAGGRLEGMATGREILPEPTHLILAVAQMLLAIPLPAQGVAVTRYQRIDGRLAGDWSFSGVAIDPSWVVARGEAALRAAEDARDLGALLTCIECVGAMGALIEQTIAYLSNRVQFGVPLSSHQALRHRVAEMFVEYENLRALVGQALRAACDAPLLPARDIAFAKFRLGHVGRFVAESAIQCHGGMGMTEALPAIRLARRVMMAEFEYGDRVLHAARLLGAA